MTNKLFIRYFTVGFVSLSLLTFGLLIAYTGALAQDTDTPTASATITSPALGWLPTTQPLNMPTASNILCPTGAPGGWGTLTPNALWQAFCYQCVGTTPMVTTAPELTATANATQQTATSSSVTGTAIYLQTATAQGTPGPTFTPPAGPTATPYIYNRCVDLTQTAAPTRTATYAWNSVDDCPITTYGGVWNGDCTSTAGAYATTLTYQTAYQSTYYADWQFTGTGVRWYGQKGTAKGIAEWFIDDVSMGTVDEYASATQQTVLLATRQDLPYQLHTVKWKQTGTKNGSSTGYQLTIDRVDYADALGLTNTPYPVGFSIDCATGSGSVNCYKWDNQTLLFTGGTGGATGYWYDSRGGGQAYKMHSQVFDSGALGCSSGATWVTMSRSGSSAFDFTNVSCAGGNCNVNVGEEDHNFGADGVRSWHISNGMHPCHFTASAWIWLTTYPCINPATATPGPVPTQGNAGSYCNTVDDSVYTSFAYDGLQLGATYCVDVGNIHFTVLGIAIDVPWIAHLCLQDMGFGSATMLGVTISLDTILMVVGVTWAIRNLFIS